MEVLLSGDAWRSSLERAAIAFTETDIDKRDTFVPIEVSDTARAFGAHDMPDGVRDWENMSVTFFAEKFSVFAAFAILYLPVVFILRSIVMPRFEKGFSLLLPLRLWNFLMCAFSGVGAYYCLPPVYNMLTNYLGSEVICTTWCYGQPDASNWVFFFNLSKIFEFIDTLFLCLRKKPMPFLHYYHHVVTMLFCWYTNQVGHFSSCSGYYFATMNYVVHFIMYGYYFLTSFGLRPPFAKLITIVQIAQMVVGIAILCVNATCERIDVAWLSYGAVMYGSFFYLFVQIFVGRYLKRGRSSTGKQTAPTQKGGKKPKRA